MQQKFACSSGSLTHRLFVSGVDGRVSTSVVVKRLSKTHALGLSYFVRPVGQGRLCSLFSSMRRRDHCLHHVLPLFVWLITLELVAILITSLSVVPMFIRNLLWCVHCTVLYNSSVAHFTPRFHP